MSSQTELAGPTPLLHVHKEADDKDSCILGYELEPGQPSTILGFSSS